MENNDLKLVKEASTEFYIHKKDTNLIPSKSMNVFYNKRMIINRDISSLAINAYSTLFKQDELIVVDSMAASGIGSIRILKECKNIKKIYINDINPDAVKLIFQNLKLNNLDNRYNQIEITNKDTNLLFSEIKSNTEKNNKPNIISIDPFGTPNIYVDSAFKAINKVDGLMCITATDTAVLFGIRPDACFRKYLSKPLHTEYCKEIGARILIYFISRIANINKSRIIPLLTFYSGHFIRAFCLVLKGKRKITESFKNYGYILHCKNCGYRSAFKDNILILPKKCPTCQKIDSFDYAGPLWIGKIHEINFLKEILSLNKNLNLPSQKRIEKLLSYAIDENYMPFSYYNIHRLCRDLKIPSIPKLGDIISLIRKKGYQCSRTHFDYLSIKGDMDLFTLKDTIVELQK
ncbi:MAG: tRNA (guanine(10)-N(2))-dimethyltransferase [Candidatus Thorarchaeota archaeon]